MTKQRRIATRDSFKRNSQARKYGYVDVPEDIPEIGGESIRVRSLTLSEFIRSENRLADPEIANTIGAQSCVIDCIVDEQGNTIFTDEDAAWLGDTFGGVLNLVKQECRLLSGFASELDSEETEKNSEPTPDTDSQ